MFVLEVKLNLVEIYIHRLFRCLNTFRPSGNLIASSQQTPDEHRVIFYERNGLRHGEFVLPFLPNEQKVMEKCDEKRFFF